MPTIYNPAGDDEQLPIEEIARRSVASGCPQFVFKGTIYAVTVGWKDTGYRTVKNPDTLNQPS